MEADSFVRHYEDAARIVRAADRLPAVDGSVRALAEDNADDASLVLAEAEKRRAIERAHQRIDPMFWGPRIPLDEACHVLREWVRDCHVGAP